VAQFKRGDFSTCDAPRPGRHKTVTTPQIIDQIHELILEDRRIFIRLSVRTQIHERFAENMKFQISVIIIISNIFGHNTDKALLNFFPYFITPVRVFLFPNKF